MIVPCIPVTNVVAAKRVYFSSGTASFNITSGGPLRRHPKGTVELQLIQLLQMLRKCILLVSLGRTSSITSLAELTISNCSQIRQDN